jgi:hypothetical protein
MREHSVEVVPRNNILVRRTQRENNITRRAREEDRAISESNQTREMPLVKIFARRTLGKPIPLKALQSKLCEIWGTKPDTTKLMLCMVEDWTDDSFKEDCYVDIRAYGKADRTREVVLDGMKRVRESFLDHDLIANVRLETYDGERYFHLPPNTTPPSS